MAVSRPIVVMQLPERLNPEHAQIFLQEVEPLLEAHRPRVVLDCSPVCSVDGAGVEMLLHCLEEAMKRDGDLKLCAVSSQLQVILELMRVDRVFEIFATCEEAVRSFSTVPAEGTERDERWNAFRELRILKQAS